MENSSGEEFSSEERVQKQKSGDENPSKSRRLILDIIDVVETTLVVMWVFMMCITYFVHPVVVVGNSMNPTLYNDDRTFMITMKTNYSTGDIIVLDNNSAYLLDEETGEAVKSDGTAFHECIIKRVIASGGQTVDIDYETGEVIVDGEALDEPYIAESMRPQGDAFDYPITVPEGYYFVLGDNRNHSADSRFSQVGLADADDIYGKVYVKYYPFSEFKFV